MKMTDIMNPVGQAQHEVAEMLRADEWIRSRRVEVVEQNSRGLLYLMRKSIAQLQGVAVVVGCDSFTNDHPALEMDLTISCTENIVQNRDREGAASALDVAQAIVKIVDGEWWHFEECRHESPDDGVLVATATFKGLVKRV